MPESRDDLNAYPSETDLAQRELREALFLSESMNEIDSNTRELLQNNILNRNVYETRRLIHVIRRSQAIYQTDEGH